MEAQISQNTMRILFNFSISQADNSQLCEHVKDLHNTLNRILSNTIEITEAWIHKFNFKFKFITQV